jgi:hypothetical protein
MPYCELTHPHAGKATLVMPGHPLEHCRGSFPTADGDIVLEWRRGSEPILTLPKGWQTVK